MVGCAGSEFSFSDCKKLSVSSLLPAGLAACVGSCGALRLLRGLLWPWVRLQGAWARSCSPEAWSTVHPGCTGRACSPGLRPGLNPYSPCICRHRQPCQPSRPWARLEPSEWLLYYSGKPSPSHSLGGTGSHIPLCV